jgi:hypothetical protein
MTPQAIRDAVAAGDYAAASALFGQYARSLPLDHNALAELGELAQWTGIVVLCAKAHAEDQARTLRAEVQIARAYTR